MGRLHVAGTTGLELQLPSWSSVTSTGLTIAAWVCPSAKPGNYAGACPILRSQQYSGAANGIFFYRVDNGNQDSIQISGNGTVIREPYALDTWYYVALVQSAGATFDLTWYVYDTSNATWYSETVTGNTDTSEYNLYAILGASGRVGGLNSRFTGDISNARVFTSALTQEQLTAERDSETAVLSAYSDCRLVDGYYTTDSSGNSRGYTLSSGETAPTAGSIDPPISAGPQSYSADISESVTISDNILIDGYSSYVAGLSESITITDSVAAVGTYGTHTVGGNNYYLTSPPSRTAGKTVIIWAKYPTSGGSIYPTFWSDEGTDSSNRHQLGIDCIGDTRNLFFYNGSAITLYDVYSDWFGVALVYSATQLTVDVWICPMGGTPTKVSSAISYSTTTTTETNIGTDNGNNENTWWVGDVGYHYIFASPLSDAQVIAQFRQRTPVTTAWAAHYLEAADASDSSGNNRALTARGTPTVASSGVVFSSSTTLAVNDGYAFWSPYNVYVSESYAAMCVPGAYLKTSFSGTWFKINVDVSRLVSASVTAGNYPIVRYSINDGYSWVESQLTSSTTSISASGLSAGVHPLRFEYVSTQETTDRWSAHPPPNTVIVTSIEAQSFSAPTVAADTWRFDGDSITEGINVYSSGGTPSTNCAYLDYARLVADASSVEFCQLGYGGAKYYVGGGGGSGNVPSYTTSATSYFDGYSRLVDGYLSPAPKKWFVELGTNDNTDITSTVQNRIAAMRTEAGAACDLYILIPLTGNYRSEITAGVSNYQSAHSSDTHVHLIDFGSLSVDFTDGLHPSQAGHVTLANALLAAIGAQSYTAAVSETITLSDSFAALRNAIVAADETISLSDSLSSAVAAASSISESISLSDALGSAVAALTGISESISLSDALSSVVAAASGISESITLSDDYGSLAAFTLGLSESLTISDIVEIAGVGEYLASLSESITVGESIGLVLGIDVAVGESVSMSDSASLHLAANAGLSATLSYSDDLGMLQAGSLGISETLAISDLLLASQGSAASVEVGEAWLWGSSVGGQLGAVAGLNDSMTFADAFESQQTGLLSVGEIIMIQDAISSGNRYPTREPIKMLGRLRRINL